MNLPDAIDFIRPSVVQFGVIPKGNTVMQPFGSGFILNQDGYVATAAHVVQAINEFSKSGHMVHIGLAYPDTKFVGKEGATATMTNCFHAIGADVLAMDDAYDVALLKMKPNPFEFPPRSMVKIDGSDGPVPLYKGCATSTDQPRDGDYIAVSGYPLSSPSLITTAGNLASGSATVDFHKTMLYLADISVNPGNSGGPTYRVEDGCVIGVCTAYQNAPLMFMDQTGGKVTVDDRPVGINSGLSVVAPIKHVMDLVEKVKADAG